MLILTINRSRSLRCFLSIPKDNVYHHSDEAGILYIEKLRKMSITHGHHNDLKLLPTKMWVTLLGSLAWSLTSSLVDPTHRFTFNVEHHVLVSYQSKWGFCSEILAVLPCPLVFKDASATPPPLPPPPTPPPLFGWCVLLVIASWAKEISCQLKDCQLWHQIF